MMTTTLRKQNEKGTGAGGGASRLTRRLHLDLTQDGVAIITFDHPGKTANVFDEAALDELDLALNAVERLAAKGVVFLSSKASIFVAGADLDSLSAANGPVVERLTRKGQDVFQRIAGLSVPTVAGIHGACLGGGLELALACDWRLASGERVTRIGLPEVLLGIIPAWGGSTRLPRLIGLSKALKLILSGKALASRHARKLGVVDEVVPEERLREAALAVLKRGKRKPRLFPLANNRCSSALIRRVARRKTWNRTRGNYPAPVAAIEVVTRGGYGPLRASLAREREAVRDLAETPAAKNLMRLFHLQERAKKFRFPPGAGEEAAAEAKPVERTAVIGAGVMGSGIAQWFSSRELPVILQDVDRAKVAAGMESVRKLYDAAVGKRILTPHEAGRRLDLVNPSAEPLSLRRCDLVVEAAVENLAVKKKIFADLCGRSSPDTILATNTSALPISELCLAPGVTGPERIVGIHFFNPVSRMKLVEIVVTERTSPEVIERTLAFVRRIGKLPVVVKDSPGFVVNRILMPYLIEAGRLVDEGCDPALIDRAMLDFGMPMGPFRLLDEVGLDVAAHVAETMREAFGDRFDLPRCLHRLLEEGALGRKTGRGFYRYANGKAAKRFPAKGDRSERAGIAIRLAGLMADEARRCLDEGIARDADDIDLDMVLGTGFAPFRGGPLTWDETERISILRDEDAVRTSPAAEA